MLKRKNLSLISWDHGPSSDRFLGTLGKNASMHSFRRHPDQPTAAFHPNPLLHRLIQELLEQHCTAPFDDFAEFVTLPFVVVIGSTDGH